MKSSIAFLFLVFVLGCSSLENCARSSTVAFDSLYIPYLYSMPWSSPYASDYFGFIDIQLSSVRDDFFHSSMPLTSVGDFSISSPVSFSSSSSSCSSCCDLQVR